MIETSTAGRQAAALAALVVMGCGAACPGGKTTDTAAPLPETRVITLFYVTSLGGAYEPCGCEPGQLGGFDRMLGILAERAKGSAGSALVAAGRTLVYKGEKGRRAKIRADLVADLLRQGGVVAVAPGPADLVLSSAGDGPAAAPPWVAANVEGLAGTVAHAVVDVGGVRVGLVGVSGTPEPGDPAPGAAVKIIADPAAAAGAARAAVDAARRAGAQVVVVLLDGERRDAYALAAKVPGIDFVVAGRSERAMPFAEAIEGTGARVIEAGQLGEHLGVLELHLPGGAGGAPAAASFASGDDAAQAAAELARVRAQIAEIEGRLAAAGTGAPAGDLGPLLARKRDEEKALAARAAATAPPPPPFFRHRVEPVKDTLPGVETARARIEEYALALAALDYEEETPVPEPEKGKASYIGAEACKECHEEEYAVWKKTRHAGAMVTLVDKKRDKVAECVSCHVAGFRAAGGSSLHDLKGLGGVQCENCHGAGSRHEAKLGHEKPREMRLTTSAEECTSWCHHPPHDSDFSYHAKLEAGVLGRGHGDKLLAKIRAAATAAPAPAPGSGGAVPGSGGAAPGSLGAPPGSLGAPK